MAIDYISIGQRIKTIRKRRGISQAALAERIDLSATYISYIESGVKSLSLDTFVMIANALNVTADELLVDNLENTVKVFNHEFAAIIVDCSNYERRVLLESAAALKESMRSNRRFLQSRQ